MATQPQHQPRPNAREEIIFPANIPVTVTMKFAQPKLVSGIAGERYLFTTTDNRVFFLDPPVAAQIAALAINVREPFTITKLESGQRGAAVEWRVARIAEAQQPQPQAQAPVQQLGAQPDGTFVVPRDADAAAAGERKPMARATALVAEANDLVDAYAEVLGRALAKHQGRVKPDEVRALLISTYIKQTRGAA